MMSIGMKDNEVIVFEQLETNSYCTVWRPGASF